MGPQTFLSGHRRFKLLRNIQIKGLTV